MIKDTQTNLVDSFKMERFKLIAVLAIPFSVAVSVCYLWGFWGSFEIDVFSYITASQLTVISAVPLLGTCLFSLVGIVIGMVFFRVEEKPENEGGDSKKKPPKQRSKLRIWSIRVLNALVVVLLLLVVIFGDGVKWIFLPGIWAIFLSLLVVGAVRFQMKTNEYDKYLPLVLILIYLPCQGFGYGKKEAFRIKSGLNYRYLTSVVEGIQPAEDRNYRYIGRAGDDIFFFDARKDEVLIVGASIVGHFRLKTYSLIDEEKEK